MAVFCAVVILLVLFHYQPAFLSGVHQGTEYYVPEKTDNLSLWYPYINSGMPVWGSEIGSPISLLWDQPIYRLFTLFHLPEFSFFLFHILLFALFLYVMLREFDLSPFIAGLFTCAFIFSPHMTHLNVNSDPQIFLAIVPIPLVIFFTKRLMQSKGILYLCLTALALAIQWMRDHFYLSAVTMIFLFVFFIHFIITQRTRSAKKRYVLQQTRLFSATLVFALSLSALYIVSRFDYSRFAVATDMEPVSAGTWPLQPMRLLSHITPLYLCQTSGPFNFAIFLSPYSLYCGIIVLFLAGFGIVLVRDRYARFFAFISIPLLLLLELPLGSNRLFFVRRIEIYTALFFFFSLSLLILAAYGLQALISLKKAKLPIIERLSVLFLVMILMGALFLFGVKSKIIDLLAEIMPHTTYVQRQSIYTCLSLHVVKAILLTVFSMFALSLYIRKKLSFSGVAITFSILMIVDLYISGIAIAGSRSESTPLEKRNEVFDDLLKYDNGIYRIFPLFPSSSNPCYENIIGEHKNKLKIYQEFLRETGYDIFKPHGMNGFLSKYRRLVMREDKILYQPMPELTIPEERLAFDHAMLDMLNVKYIISPDSPLNDHRYQRLWEEETSTYVNTTALPRVFFADSSITLTGRRRIFDYMKNGQFDPRHVAIIEESPPFRTFPAQVNTASITARENSRIEIMAEIKSPSILILSEIFYPSGWKATIDGQETKIYKTNYILRSVFLQPGRHRVVFTFKPMWLSLGLWTNGVTLLALIGLLIFAKKH